MRKHTRRKIWSTQINPIKHAIDGAGLIPQKELDELRIRELASIEAFRTGQAKLQEWHDLTAMLNLCEVMARSNIGPEALEACAVMQQAMIEAARRFEKTGKMGLSGSGLVAARDVYEFHDLQRQSVARSVYEQNIARVMALTKSRAPGVTVIT